MTIMGSISSIGSMKMGGSSSSIKSGGSKAGFGSNKSSDYNYLTSILGGTVLSVTGLFTGLVIGAVDGFTKGLNFGIELAYPRDHLSVSI